MVTLHIHGWIHDLCHVMVPEHDLQMISANYSVDRLTNQKMHRANTRMSWAGQSRDNSNCGAGLNVIKKTYWTSRACWLPSIHREVKNVIWTLISVQFIVSMDNVILAKRVTDRVGGAQSPQRREAPSLDPMSRRTREGAHRRMRISVRVIYIYI